MKRPHWIKLTPRVALSLVLATTVSGAIVYLVVVFPQWQTAALVQTIKDYKATPTADPQALASLEQGQLDTENAIRTAVMQSFGGMAFLLGLYFTYWHLSMRAQTLQTSVADIKARQRSLLLAEERQAAERFSQAVERLGHCNMHVRLGGIYALERLANDSDQYYPQVMAVLAAFVRAESPYPPRKAAPVALTATPIEQGSGSLDRGRLSSLEQVE
jgi:hypothetical protein